MNKELREAVYGFAVGDALGVPYEFKRRDTFLCTDMVGFGTWNQPPGTWSDDTSMVLATCDSIGLCGRIDTDNIRYQFQRWYQNAEYTAHGEVFDIGMTTETALLNREGCKTEWSNGNGSLMRILPLAFVNHSLKTIDEVSAITHAHDISKEACAIYVYIAERLLYGHDLDDVIFDLFYGGVSEQFERLERINSLKRSEIKSSGYVVDTLEACLWCVANTDNYRDCVLTAVNLGEDTDTIAALAGGLAGIVYGYDAIPTEWIARLANKELIDRCLF